MPAPLFTPSVKKAKKEPKLDDGLCGFSDEPRRLCIELSKTGP